MAGPADDQFISLLQGLGKQVQSYGLSQAINTANEQVATIKQQMAPDINQRRALQDLADRTALNLTAGGADPAQVQLARQSMIPPQANSVMQAQLSGDPYLMKAATDLQTEEEDRTMRKLQEQQMFQMKLTERLETGRDNRANLAAERAANKAARTPTAQNLKAAGYASQLVQADSTFNQLQSKGINGAENYRSLTNFLPNIARYDTSQQLDQLQRQFVNGIARPESGAVIGPKEMEGYKQTYFPQPGDGEATIRQKAQARKTAIQKTIIEAGPAGGYGMAEIPGGAQAMGHNVTNFADPSLSSPKSPVNVYIVKKRK